MKVGLSLSLCIRDILEGKVSLDEVERIVTSTKCRTPADWTWLLENYRREYWGKDPDLGEKIARQLLAAGKIEQPRMNDPMVTSVKPKQGLWINPGETILLERKPL